MYWKSFVNRYILVISWRLIRISHCQRIVRIISLKRKCTKRSEQSVTTFKANYWMFSDTKNVLTTLSNVLYVHEIPGSIIFFFANLVQSLFPPFISDCLLNFKGFFGTPIYSRLHRLFQTKERFCFHMCLAALELHANSIAFSNFPFHWCFWRGVQNTLNGELG